MIQGQQAMQERETEQVIGQLTGIVQKGPDKWQAVVVPDGSQYSKNLWTKDAALIGSLSTMIGQRLAFACNVSHWKMQDGTAVRSLWIDVAGRASTDSTAMQGPAYVQQAQQAQNAQPQMQQSVQPQVQVQQQVPAEVKEQRIHRQTASKVAAILLSNLDKEYRTMDTLLQLSERLVHYYTDGLPPRTLDDEIQRATPQTVDEMIEPGGEDWHDPDDDSIPF